MYSALGPFGIYFYLGGLRADKIGTVKFVMLLLEIGYGSTATLSDRDCRRFKLTMSKVSNETVLGPNWGCPRFRLALFHVKIWTARGSNLRFPRFKLALFEVKIGAVPGPIWECPRLKVGLLQISSVLSDKLEVGIIL